MAPIYEFVCVHCASIVEKMQDYAQAAPSCEECGSQMKRRVSRTNFSLKGDNWGRDCYGIEKPVRAKDS